ncbi:uncharacterized protein LOC129601022 [Paramacrobiotus metropolitanus]|uniref:uncharacterized protein LOC129601022 n=1 Tax=Paramacrobiotus metropolitanus TaxID=2943436 RepID=UPI0024463D6C|nr:uncharacterized protein LOC129601022 [Paramacrobiotus metropolitanus]
MNDIIMSSETCATRPEIPYQLVELLNDKRATEIHLAHRTDDVQPVEIVVKKVELDFDRENAYAQAASLDADLKYILSFDHPHLVRHLAHYNPLQANQLEESHYIIIMEYCSGGNLHAAAQFRIPAPLIQEWTRQIVDGLVYLHAQNILHGHIKGSRVLLSNQDWNTCQMKIGHLDAPHRPRREMAVRQDTGRYAFMAPEMIVGDDPGRKADIWSVGCVVLEMISGFLRFVKEVAGQQVDVITDTTILYYVGTGGSPRIPHEVPNELRMFITDCLQRDPVLRPTAADLLNKTFLTTTDVTQWSDLRPQRA